mmetsp:Transcript_34492/g.47792  ORF Transcript_34492/g.47792 Transcript_34492/m.47792 type:complete len:172 (+) Transcript_34492:87-602(+)|eukprot:CAMPEP_0196579498 /NCGR_PEP_ID=MMETSP1081-20130531/22040_1 /TAXON_ID=36882 /ORGANISM="Pyramimonas amylifera, Strain CCMP720" /LENGTH=171 /DNA_ID=CAMNT_0041899115 /DNA_START=87 /DNA_END=602 /DNA_ORIENTATION=+
MSLLLSGFLRSKVLLFGFEYGDSLIEHVARKFRASIVTSEAGRLNHVAIAVPDLAAAAQTYKDVIGVQVSAQQDLLEHGVSVVFVTLPNTKIELLHPLGENSPIAKFLEKNPAGGLHHICLETDDLKDSITNVSKTVRVLGEPKIGAHGNPVVFLHPKDMAGTLVELEEKL